LSAAEHLIDDTDSEEDIRLLIAPVVAWRRSAESLGARQGRHLAIAKLPRNADEYSIVR
jgi:hypothetical protein